MTARRLATVIVLPIFGLLSVAAVAWACTVAVSFNTPPSATPGDTGIDISGGTPPPSDPNLRPANPGTVHIRLMDANGVYNSPTTIELAQVPATVDSRGIYTFSAKIAIPAATRLGAHQLEAQDTNFNYLQTAPINIVSAPVPPPTVIPPTGLQNPPVPPQSGPVPGPAGAASASAAGGSRANGHRSTAATSHNATAGQPLAVPQADPATAPGAAPTTESPVQNATSAAGDLWGGFNRPDRSVGLAPHAGTGHPNAGTVAGLVLLVLGIIAGLTATVATVAARRRVAVHTGSGR